MGRSAVKEGVQKGKVRLVLVAQDLSVRSDKEVSELCDLFKVKRLKTKISIEELSNLLGKDVGVVGILNDGIANRINEIFEISDKEECIL